MWLYEKKLQYPVKICRPNPNLATAIITQLGGPNGELGAATRYLQQRYTMPQGQVKGMLTDIGTEELGHMEMISAIVYQLTRNLTPQQLKEGGFDAYFVDHTTGVYPQAACGVPFNAGGLQVVGDPIADLYEDLAAEQKARVTYDNLLRIIDDPDVLDPIRFLRAREVVHFQRFGESLGIVQDALSSKNFYAFNPAFDANCFKPTDPCDTPTPQTDCGCAPLPAPQTDCECTPPAPNCGCATPVQPKSNGTCCRKKPACAVPMSNPNCKCPPTAVPQMRPSKQTTCCNSNAPTVVTPAVPLPNLSGGLCGCG